MNQSEPQVERREVYFSGRVQGVGFRYTTRAIAARFPVRGFVRNMSDGRVLLVVEGPTGSLEAFLDAVSAEMERYIEHTSTSVSPPRGEFDGFEIRH